MTLFRLFGFALHHSGRVEFIFFEHLLLSEMDMSNAGQ